MRTTCRARLRLVLAPAVLALSMLLAGRATADGIYIPERAFKKPPAIPSQRALIVLRDGVERLIVESTLDGEGRSFGWIVPVPAVPTALEAVSPGIMDVLDFHTQPRITHDLRGNLVPVCALAAFLVLLFALIIFSPGGKSFVSYLVLLLLCVLLAGFLLPTLSHGGAPEIQSTSVRVLSAARIGNYDVSVLKAEDGAALASWLDANGFASLPDEGLPLVDDYIARGWVFVTAKLIREGSGRAAPHPLSITFASARPVYPMRLTALAGTKLALDLYVLAQQRARECDGMKLEYCDTYPAADSVADGDRTYSRVVAGSSRRELAHPALMDIVWPGAVLTKLSAEVEPAEMKADYVLGMAAPLAYLPHVFSRQGAAQAAALTALVFWSGLLFVLTLLKRGSIRERGRAYAGRRIVLPVTIAALLVVPLLYFALPKVDVVTGGRRFFSDRTEAKSFANQASLLACELENIQDKNIGEIRAFFAEHLRQDNYRNYLTGKPIAMGDSPGNYTIDEKDGKTVFTAYTMTGRPYRVTLREPEPKETMPPPVSTDSILNAAGHTGAEPPPDGHR